MPMTIDKAIEILYLITDTPPSGANPDFVDAVKLGTEALKRLGQLRSDRPSFPHTLLPGETEK